MSRGFEHRLYGWKGDLEEEQKDESAYLTTSATALLNMATQSAIDLGHREVTVEVLLSLLGSPGPWSQLQPSYLGHYVETLSGDAQKTVYELRRALNEVERWKRRIGIAPRSAATQLRDVIKRAHQGRREMKDRWTTVDHLVLAVLKHVTDGRIEQIFQNVGVSRNSLIARITADRFRKSTGGMWDSGGTCANLSSICDDIIRLAERKEPQSSYGREADLKFIMRRVLSGSQKLLIIGPSGSGKTQLVDSVALALGRHIPEMTPAGSEAPKVKLLRLDFNRLAAQENKKQGGISELLLEAKMELGMASRHEEAGGLGIKFIIVIDDLLKGLSQPHLVPALLLFMYDANVAVIAIDTQENWNESVRLHGPSFARFEIHELGKPTEAMAKVIAINSSKRLMLRKPCEIDDLAIEEAINLIYRPDTPAPFPDSVAAVMEVAVELAMEAQRGPGFLSEMRAEVAMLASKVDWANRPENLAPRGAMVMATALSRNLETKRKAIDKYSRNPQAGHIALAAMKSKFDAVVTVLRECYDIHNWAALEASKDSNPKAYALYPDLAIWSNSIAMSQRTGYPAAHVTVSDIRNAAQQMPRWSTH